MGKVEEIEERSVDAGQLKSGIKLQTGHKIVLIVTDNAGTPGPAKSGSGEKPPAGTGKPAEHKPPPKSEHKPEAHRPEAHKPEAHKPEPHKPEPHKPEPKHEEKPPPKKKDPSAPKHPAPPQTGTIREKIVANAEWGIKNEPHIHYKEVRPIPALNHPHQLP